MTFPIDMMPVIGQFLRRITAYDETSKIVDYKSRAKTVSADYTFVGVIIPPSDKDLQLLEEGEIKQGAVTVYTNRELFFPDIDTVTASSVQTYIKFEGDNYRIKSCSNRIGDGNYRKYMAVREVRR